MAYQLSGDLGITLNNHLWILLKKSLGDWKVNMLFSYCWLLLQAEFFYFFTAKNNNSDNESSFPIPEGAYVQINQKPIEVEYSKHQNLLKFYFSSGTLVYWKQ